MESFEGLKFGFSVQSSGKVAAKRSNDPELVVTPTKGQIKINDATSRMLQVASRENIVLLGNRRDLENYRDAKPDVFAEYLIACAIEMNKEVVTIDDITIWGIAKGWGLFTKNGTPSKVSDRLTKVEREDLLAQGVVDAEGKVIVPEIQDTVGFRVAANGGQVGIGHIMTGNDTANYGLLGGNEEENIVYSISRTPHLVTVNNGCEDVTVKVYPLTYDHTEEKLRVAKDEKEVVAAASVSDAPKVVFEFDADNEAEEGTED